MINNRTTNGRGNRPQKGGIRVQYGTLLMVLEDFSERLLKGLPMDEAIAKAEKVLSSKVGSKALQDTGVNE